MKRLLLAGAFSEGFLLLSAELVYVRLLHPVYGDSYLIWIAMLAVTMLGSALGYFTGSYVSTRSDAWLRKFVLWNLFFLIVFFLSVSSANTLLLRLLTKVDFINGLIVHSLGILLLPVAMITLFNPLIVKYYSSGSKGSGEASGKVFFVSTVGGIFAIYAVAFLILPNFSLKTIINTLVLIPMCFNVLLLIHARQFYYLFVEAWILACLVFFITNYVANLETNMRVLYQENGIMGEIAVYEHPSNPGSRYLLLNNATQSVVDTFNGKSLLSYPYRIATYASLQPEHSRVLVAGLGGGALVNLLIDLKFEVDVIEFDQRMYDVSLKYLDMNPNFYFEVDDFRHFVNKTERKYDIIVLDLSKGETIPTNVYTVQSFKKILDLLASDGYVLLHYPRHKTEQDSLVLKSLMRSLSKAGAYVAAIRKHRGDKAVEEIVVASMDEELIRSRKFRMPAADVHNLDYVYDDLFNDEIDFSDGLLLDDERNILELLQFEAIKELRDPGRSH